MERGLCLRFAFGELLKFESVQISEFTAHCDELPPQDGTQAACLMHLAFHRWFSVVSLS